MWNTQSVYLKVPHQVRMKDAPTTESLEHQTMRFKQHHWFQPVDINRHELMLPCAAIQQIQSSLASGDMKQMLTISLETCKGERGREEEEPPQKKGKRVMKI